MAEALGPALAMLDIGDIPRGLFALDALVKEAEVAVLSAGTVQDGRYLILFAGRVDAVQRSFARALESAGRAIVDAVLLPDAEERVAPTILAVADAREDVLGARVDLRIVRAALALAPFGRREDGGVVEPFGGVGYPPAAIPDLAGVRG